MKTRDEWIEQTRNMDRGTGGCILERKRKNEGKSSTSIGSQRQIGHKQSTILEGQ